MFAPNPCIDQHPLGCDAALDPWLQQLWNVLLEVAPLPPSLPVIPSHTLLPPRYSVAVSAPQHGCESATRVEEEDKLYAQTPPFNISRPYAAVVTKNERLTATDWQQEVRHIGAEKLTVLFCIWCFFAHLLSSALCREDFY